MICLYDLAVTESGTNIWKRKYRNTMYNLILNSKRNLQFTDKNYISPIDSPVDPTELPDQPIFGDHHQLVQFLYALTTGNEGEKLPWPNPATIEDEVLNVFSRRTLLSNLLLMIIQ